MFFWSLGNIGEHITHFLLHLVFMCVVREQRRAVCVMWCVCERDERLVMGQACQMP